MILNSFPDSIDDYTSEIKVSPPPLQSSSSGHPCCWGVCGIKPRLSAPPTTTPLRPQVACPSGPHPQSPKASQRNPPWKLNLRSLKVRGSLKLISQPRTRLRGKGSRLMFLLAEQGKSVPLRTAYKCRHLTEGRSKQQYIYFWAVISKYS